jgi:hypothetical protein
MKRSFFKAGLIFIVSPIILSLSLVGAHAAKRLNAVLTGQVERLHVKLLFLY